MIKPQPEIHELANVSPTAKIWAGTQVREHASIGDQSSVGQYCYIGPGVVIGDNCKIQNHALIYEPTRIGNGVFIGPNVVITNDLHPRSLNVDGIPKGAQDWEPQAASLEHGCSLGAGVICVGPVTIGAWCMVAAGSVITKDVPNYALMAGVPARQIGWVGEAGKKLVPKGKLFECPDTKRLYSLDGNSLLVPIAN